MKRLIAPLCGIVAALALVVVAFAHAEPETASPGDGAVLAASPAQVVIEMSQEMARTADANDINVVDASGKEVTTASATIDNADRKKLTVALPPNLPTGTYTVNWKTLSADDGDAANGTLSFTVDASKTPSAGKTQLRDTGIGPSPSPLTSTTASASGTAAAGPIDAGGSGGGGTSWVLVAAVGVAMLAVGSGGTFLLVTKKEA
ncbi:MAG: copper resistance protein CopC [Tepidiformaceae bacterium]